jgi:predicted amidophosphoribosyltransferase
MEIQYPVILVEMMMTTKPKNKCYCCGKNNATIQDQDSMDWFCKACMDLMDTHLCLNCGYMTENSNNFCPHCGEEQR